MARQYLCYHYTDQEQLKLRPEHFLQLIIVSLFKPTTYTSKKVRIFFHNSLPDT